MMRLLPMLILLSGCSIVFLDELCDTSTPAGEETGVVPELLFSEVGTGATHSCGILDDASLYCWGLGDEGQLDAPRGSFKSLSVGHAHSCAIDEADEVQCWGRNDDGQTLLEGRFKQVSSGGAHTCGLEAGGQVRCVGRNDVGQTEVPEYAFLSISAGAKHTCGIVRLADEDTGASVCWGELEKEPEEEEKYRSILSGSGWACAESSTEVSCIGADGEGQHAVPEDLENDSLTAGARHGCGLNGDGLIRCWGDNEAGQTEAPSGSFKQVVAGSTSLHTCGLHAGVDDATPVTCWGLDAENQLMP